MSLHPTKMPFKVCLAAVSLLLIAVFTLLPRPSASGSEVSSARLTHAERAGLSRLPSWERGRWATDLMARRVATLPAVVPRGGVALAEPGTSAVWLYLQPATPSANDFSVAEADTAEGSQVGGNIISTVFGVGTLASALVPSGEQVPPNAVLNRPVWVVTIQDSQPYTDPSCGPAGSICSQVTYSTFVTVEDAVTGQMLAGFPD